MTRPKRSERPWHGTSFILPGLWPSVLFFQILIHRYIRNCWAEKCGGVDRNVNIISWHWLGSQGASDGFQAKVIFDVNILREHLLVRTETVFTINWFFISYWSFKPLRPITSQRNLATTKPSTCAMFSPVSWVCFCIYVCVSSNIIIYHHLNSMHTCGNSNGCTQCE